MFCKTEEYACTVEPMSESKTASEPKAVLTSLEVKVTAPVLVLKEITALSVENAA